MKIYTGVGIKLFSFNHLWPGCLLYCSDAFFVSLTEGEQGEETNDH